MDLDMVKLTEIPNNEVEQSELLILAKKIASEWGFDYDFDKQEVIEENGK